MTAGPFGLLHALGANFRIGAATTRPDSLDAGPGQAGRAESRQDFLAEFLPETLKSR